jgi:hypothetical protein
MEFYLCGETGKFKASGALTPKDDPRERGDILDPGEFTTN